MKEITYQPLWLLEMVDSTEDIISQKLVTKNIPTRPEKGLHSTGIFTKAEQIAFGLDIYGLSDLRMIYEKANDETFDLLARLVHNWNFHAVLKKLRQAALK